MSWFDGRGRAEDSQRALIGRPSLRRALSALPNDRAAALTQQLSQNFDPSRDKSRYREELQRAIQTENQLEPVREAERMNALLRRPDLTHDQRTAVNENLQRIGPTSDLSVAGRFDPRKELSTDFRRSGSLFRTF